MKKTTALLATASLLALVPVHAFNPQPDPPGFGMVGLAPGETLRLSIVNAGPNNPDRFPPGPCRVELGFLDGQGNAVGSALDQTLRPGASTHLDLEGGTRLGGGVTVDTRPVLRFEARPIFRVTSASRGSFFPPDPCIVSAEILDSATGETLVTVGLINPGVIHGFNPQPDPPGFGMIGLLPGQTARFNLVNVGANGPNRLPPGPCRALLAFLDGDGNVLSSSEVILDGGQAAFLDLPVTAGPTDTISSGPAGRVSVRPVLTFKNKPGALPPGPCFPTLEVFDQTSGWTTAFVNPCYRPRVQD